MLEPQTLEAKTKYIPVLPTQDDLPYDETNFRHDSTSRLPTQDDLPSEDDIPMETERHRLQMELLINSLKPWLAQHGGGYVNGNMFVYFSLKHLKNEHFRGPDVFVVRGVSNQERKSWVVWDEKKAPDIMIELLSKTTAKEDKGNKKQAYQNQLGAPEYFWFDPFNAEDWAGFELQHGIYQPIVPNAQNCLISQQLGLALTRWHGIYENVEAVWLRWETLDGKLLPTPQERADLAEQNTNVAEQKVNAAEQKAQAAEAEIARLKALLAEKK